jgi:hypothetical protein
MMLDFIMVVLNADFGFYISNLLLETMRTKVTLGSHFLTLQIVNQKGLHVKTNKKCITTHIQVYIQMIQVTRL